MIPKISVIIQKYFLIKKGDSVLLAVSGGPDSVAMAHVFKELIKVFNLNIGIACFNHGIREESDLEVEFVRKLASDLNAPFYTHKKNISKIAEDQKRSLEEVARVERYQFLIQIAKKNGYQKIAVAHNSNDQVETFLHRLIRGAGLKGLMSISCKINMQGVEIIRPLLSCSRNEIEAYLEKFKISSCQDKSNYEVKFTRNKIRHNLLPYLKDEFNPNIENIIYNTVENIQKAYSFIEMEAEDAFKRCVKKEAFCVKIKTDRLKRVHPYIIREIIRKAIESIKGNLLRFEYSHWVEIESLIYERPYESVVDLPQGIWIEKTKGGLIIRRREKHGTER
ncbi:MAG: tRNA lysidine(34) synthetase TilS [Candidatus Saelkia tenebricola]|nr:tRNA lysidine(34) synthetase TilS [Candidatus Saelkia tenebricola]